MRNGNELPWASRSMSPSSGSDGDDDSLAADWNNGRPPCPNRAELTEMAEVLLTSATLATRASTSAAIT
jgi:hypothetical protein